jgi:hypothetical protein
MEDGTTTADSPPGSIAGSAYAAINSVGVLTAGSVSADLTVTVTPASPRVAHKDRFKAVVVVNVEQPDPARPEPRTA